MLRGVVGASVNKPKRPAVSKQIHPLCTLPQFCTEVRVGDADQGFCALLGRLAAQLCHAVFGDHVVDVVLAGGYVGAG